MAHPRSRRQARKARGGAPRAVAATRRAERSARERRASTAHAQADRTLGTVGERPDGIFGGVPVSEFAILAGLVGLVLGLIDHGGSALEVGIVVMALGVTEVTAREHLSGFRSHAALLALLLAPAIPVFALCYWLLRRQFRVARHARVVGHD